MGTLANGTRRLEASLLYPGTTDNDDAVWATATVGLNHPARQPPRGRGPRSLSASPLALAFSAFSASRQSNKTTSLIVSSACVTRALLLRKPAFHAQPISVLENKRPAAENYPFARLLCQVYKRLHALPLGERSGLDFNCATPIGNQEHEQRLECSGHLPTGAGT